MRLFYGLLLISLIVSCKQDKKAEEPATQPEAESVAELGQAADSLIYPEEKHFKSLRQVTFGGDNAEAYWSFDDKQFSNFDQAY